MPEGLAYPDHWRVLLSLQMKTGLPQDRVVFTLNFRNDAPVSGQAEASLVMREAVRNFFFEHPDAGPTIASFMNGAVFSGGEFRTYDLGEPEPRGPVEITPVDPADMALMSAAGGPPLEVAACVTWRSNVQPPKVGTVGKPGRGRTYLGPLTNAAAANNANGIPEVAPAFRDSVKRASEALLGRVTETLVVVSDRYQQTDVVTGGWIDNAFDTQRRRGPDATARTIFQTSDANWPG